MRRFPGRRQVAIGLAALIVGCSGGRRQDAPTPNRPSQPPDPGAATVLVLPVQAGPVPNAEQTTIPANLRLDGLGQVEAELAYWLRELAPRTKWVTPDVLRRTLARTPALGINLDALEVGSFRRAQVRRIGDPLFGDLRRLAAVHDAKFALLPVAGEFRPVAGDSGRIELAVALIDATFGEVLWFGVVTGDNGPRGTAAVAGSAAQKLAGMFAQKQQDIKGAVR